MSSRRADEPTIALRYEDGTVRIDGLDDTLEPTVRDRVPELEADPRTEGWRIPAFRYTAARSALDRTTAAIDDRVLEFDLVPALDSAYQLREYQERALAAWLDTDRWADSPSGKGEATAVDSDRDTTKPGRPMTTAPGGVLELPTGSGKTVIAIEAIARLAVPTLVVVPTIDLLDQWHLELSREFDVAIGRLGGGQQRLEPITVSTYDSAYLKADSIGDRFGLVVFDEVHHLGGEGYREIARLLAAPARVGLTATFERADGAHTVIEDLIGPLVFELDPDDLAGTHLAEYDIKRIAVSLTPGEREEYDRKQDVFASYLAQSNIRMQSGSDYQELVKRSGSDPEAREALLARQRAREIVYGSAAKLDALEEIFDDHRGERTIVFTAHNDLAYDVSERFLLPTITHQTGAAERREILDRFRAGTYTRIATSNVLDEGVDVPDASIAVILSGSGSEREFIQRLGRILRPTEDDRRAILYEVIAANTSEEGVSSRRRDE